MEKKVLISVDNLKTYFNTDEGTVKAVDGVSFSLNKKETLGIVGESGSGKSVMNLSILRLIQSPPGKIVDGRIMFHNEDILKMSKHNLQKIRGNKISMIFQDPMTSLNPFLKISTQMIETITLHQGLNKRDARDKSVEMLKMVGIPKPGKRVDDYPHQFSGGMRQRVMIAQALSCNPELLIADEPTTALDVTIQAQILEIMQELSNRLGTSLIMITHDLGVVAGMCDKIIVMYAGKILESASTLDLFADPKHPYTKGLINSVPRMDKITSGKLQPIPGQPPNVIDLPVGCPFYPRCTRGMDICKSAYPPERSIETDNGERSVNCWLYE